MVRSSDRNRVHVFHLENLAKVFFSGRRLAHLPLRSVGELSENVAVHIADMRNAGGAPVRLQRGQMRIAAPVQTNHRKVEAFIRTQDLGIASCRSSHGQSSRAPRKCIEKFASCSHDFSLNRSQPTGWFRSAGNPSSRQRLLKSIHANSRGRLGRACPPPVCLETQPVTEAVTLQCFYLSTPIHDAGAYRSPIVFVIGLAHHILAMAVSDAVSGQQLISAWIWRTSYCCGISRIPVQHEILVRNCLQHRSRLF